jgi:hypothetical protein
MVRKDENKNGASYSAINITRKLAHERHVVSSRTV